MLIGISPKALFLKSGTDYKGAERLLAEDGRHALSRV